MRKNSDLKYDKDGNLASSGEINTIILEQAQELYANRINKDKLSFDVSDFDISFARGLTLEDGVATLTEFTSKVISESLNDYLSYFDRKIKNVLVLGGGRKNKLLIKKIKNFTLSSVDPDLIDKYGVDGDYIESQAFAFIAIRSLKNLPITFPNTTGCKKPNSGGELIEN